MSFEIGDIVYGAIPYGALKLQEEVIVLKKHVYDPKNSDHEYTWVGETEDKSYVGGFYSARFCYSAVGHIGNPCVICEQDWGWLENL